MCVEKHVLAKEIFTIQWKVGLLQWTETKRQSMEWKHTNFPIMKKFWVQWSVKKVMLSVFWDMKELLTIDFLEKVATANSGSYCQLLRQNLPYLLNVIYIYIYII